MAFRAGDPVRIGSDSVPGNWFILKDSTDIRLQHTTASDIKPSSFGVFVTLSATHNLAFVIVGERSGWVVAEHVVALS